MTSLFKLNLLFLFIIIFTSCDSGEDYHDLTNEEKGFLLYETNDTFNLRNISTNEVINLTIETKEFNYSYVYGYGSIALGTSDDYNEIGEYSFSDNSGCFYGTVSIKATQDEIFYLSIFLGDCFGDFTTYFEPENEIVSVVINGIEYPETYILNSVNNYSLFYSKQNGIIKIVDDSNEEVLFSIE